MVNSNNGDPTVRHVYIHVPFCARRCSYCDFSIAVRSTTPVDEYVQALTAEVQRHTTSHWQLATIYLGGGTPSRLGGDGVARVVQIVRDHVEVAHDAEITIEANPDDVTPEHVRAWHTAGVNRVSLGVQSFDQRVLQWMHRTHTVEQSAGAMQTLRAGGIENISIDLIFALPDTLGRDWERDVASVIALAPAHVSLYGLTVEEHTPLARWQARGEITEATEETYERDFLYAHEQLGQAGFDHYEVSNYGWLGFHSRHNSAYWSGVPYAGLGPSAHGFDGTRRAWNVPAYAEWVKRIGRQDSIEAGHEVLSDANRAAERVYLGLRTSSGLFASDAEMEIARPWVPAGWAQIQDRTIVLTPAGWLRLDSLAASLTLAGSH